MKILLMEFLYTLSLDQKILIIYNSHAINEITDVRNAIECNYFNYGSNIVKFIDIDILFSGSFNSPLIKYFKIYIE